MTEQRFLSSSDGTKVFAEACGDPSNPSIVFLHGFALSGGVFDNIFSEAKCSKEFFLVRYDMRGHGRSGKPDSEDGYASKLLADDFAAVKTGFKLRSPVLVAWSFAGTLIPDIAANLPPETLAGAVYYAAQPWLREDAFGVQKPEAFPPVMQLTDDSCTPSVASKACLDFVDSLFRLDTQVEVDKGVQGSWKLRCEWAGMSLHQTPMQRRLIALRAQDPTALLALGKEGKLPVLGLFGAYDALMDVDGFSGIMKPHFPQLEVKVIKKGGHHAVHYSNPEEFMESIFSFARRAQT